tara:strand:- start:58 stop:255 length:198 start_codon:yes stop_codon:yes gene_type:complete
MNEKQKDCSMCESTDISKLLTKPLFFEKKNEKSKTGELTKQYIEDNKKVLEDLKEEVRSINYDKS